MIDGRKLFDNPAKNDLWTYDNVQKIETGQEYCINGCLLGYIYFKKYYKILAIDLSKQ